MGDDVFISVFRIRMVDADAEGAAELGILLIEILKLMIKELAAELRVLRRHLGISISTTCLVLPQIS